MNAKLKLYNTLKREKQDFSPLDENNVRMYVCGPTVYARPHLGNARSVVVYDVLYRLLRHIYGEDHVTYVRNITDVDDKINKAAMENGETIQALTARVTGWFHDDMDALNCLRPTHEPRATQYIPHMIAMIEKLIENGHAYAAEGHVLFDVTSRPHPNPLPEGEGTSAKNPSPTGRGRSAEGDSGEGCGWRYGMLSGRTTEEQQAGARVAVESYKRHPGDFVLWKPADEEDDASSKFASPWGVGRPGWHIECSAMSTDLLGETFDLHGGGADLKFPHHENEIAQSCCANPGSEFARTWVHNGFLTVNGEKMAKSLGNFITVRDLLDGNPLPLREGAGGGVDSAALPPTQPSPSRGEGYHGEVIRLALLSAKYNEPLNWTEKLVEDAKKTLYGFYRIRKEFDLSSYHVSNPHYSTFNSKYVNKEFIEALRDDLNIPKAIACLHKLAKDINSGDLYLSEKGEKELELYVSLNMLGFFDATTEEVMGTPYRIRKIVGTESSEQERVREKIAARAAAKTAKNWAEADRIRDELKAQGIVLEDRPDGTTDWRRA